VEAVLVVGAEEVIGERLVVILVAEEDGFCVGVSSCSCFVVVGGKDVRKPARIPFSMVCRAGDYMDVCKNVMCSTIVSVSTIEFSGCCFVVCVSIVHSLLDYLVPCRIILPCGNRYSFFLSNSAFHLGSQSFPIDRRDSNASYLN